MFQVPHGCSLVLGYITPTGVCDRFEAKGRQGGAGTGSGGTGNPNTTQADPETWRTRMQAVLTAFYELYPLRNKTAPAEGGPNIPGGGGKLKVVKKGDVWVVMDGMMVKGRFRTEAEARAHMTKMAMPPAV